MASAQKNNTALSPALAALIEKLSPLERKLVPHLQLTYEEIKKKTELDDVSLMRALRFLENKDVLKVTMQTKTMVGLGTNGIYYKKNCLPERSLLLVLEEQNHLSLEEARKRSKLSDNEFRVSLGVLKNKALLSLANGKLSLKASKEELIKKSFEEQLLETLPRLLDSLPPELRHALENLKKRKDIVELSEEKTISFSLSEIGKALATLSVSNNKILATNLIEELTPEILKVWNKSQRFRKYDIHAPVPRLHGGKRHFVTRAIEEGKRVWLDLGFKEMSGALCVSSFWNFDALFTAQDHPVRDIHDTFFIADTQATLPDKKIVERVKEAHESGVDGSKGWHYFWNENTARRVLLRTHTTCLSAQTLARLKKENLPAKYFAIGKCFRNETVDWKHGFEFNQTEGIVVDPNANFRNLLGYLATFAKKMGFEKVRFQPSYFPYTEPSVEGLVWHEEKKEWIEVLAAGIFRPEVTVPLLGSPIPVLAWGPGFDRLMVMALGLKDLRDVYANDLRTIREMPLRRKR
jgi:phenylalanyl-tRNA synthetase alpha chain